MLFLGLTRSQILHHGRFQSGLVGLALFALVLSSSTAEAARRRSSGIDWKPRFESQISFKPAYYPASVGDDIPQVQSALEGTFEFSLKPRKWLRFKLAPTLYADPLAKSAREQVFFDVPEAYLDSRVGEWSFQLGLFSQTWGVTDVYNPLDVVNARRYFDPLNAGKRGAPTVELKYDTGTWSAEAFYIPIQFPSILPGENSRWLPREIVVNRGSDFAQAQLPENLRYSYRGDEVLDRALDNNFGGRFEYHGTGFDFSAVFFQGTPTAPAIFPDVTGTVISVSPEIIVQLDPDVRLTPTYYTRRTVGGSVVVPLESSIIRLAGASSDRLSSRSDLPGWSQSAVLGLEHNIAVSASTLTLLLQLTYAQHEEQADNSVTSIDRIFDQSAMLGFRLATSGDWTYSGAGLYDSIGKSWFAQLKAETKVTDGLTAFLSAEIIEGPAETPLGTYRKNDRVSLGTTLYW